MAKEFIHGFAGNFARAYSGGNFVAMGPCPAQWNPVNESVSNGTPSYGAGWVRLDISPNLSLGASLFIDLQMHALPTAKTSIGFTLSKGGSATYATGSVITLVSGSFVAGSDTLDTRDVAAGSLAIPYYRFRLGISLNVETAGSGGWGRFDFTLS